MKVISVSRVFPATHPRKGDSTDFIEKILKSLYPNLNQESILNLTPKHHTIRKGSRWQKGEMASLKYWSGRPYHTTPVEFAQVEIVETKKILIFLDGSLDIRFDIDGIYLNHSQIQQLCQNDGLSFDDLQRWFFPKKNNKVGSCFIGQIICWTPVNQY